MGQDELDNLTSADTGDADAQELADRWRAIRKEVSDKRRLALKNATPIWADLAAIELIYAESRRLTLVTGIKHNVDHIIPLQGKRVCGLHIPCNLRVITKAANVRKHAKFGDEDVVGFLAERGFEVIYGIRKLKQAIKAGRRLTVLQIQSEGRTVLEVAYLHGEFVIEPASTETLAVPGVLIARKTTI